MCFSLNSGQPANQFSRQDPWTAQTRLGENRKFYLLPQILYPLLLSLPGKGAFRSPEVRLVKVDMVSSFLPAPPASPKFFSPQSWDFSNQSVLHLLLSFILFTDCLHTLFETMPHYVDLDGLESNIQLRLASNSWILLL